MFPLLFLLCIAFPFVWHIRMNIVTFHVVISRVVITVLIHIAIYGNLFGNLLTGRFSVAAECW